jgi:hypothetical protein
VRDYWRERFPLRLYLPVAIALALAAQVRDANVSSLAADSGFALLLLAQFRLWDDLADRAHDAARHPGRALVRSPTTLPYTLACVLLGGTALALVSLRPGALAGIVALGALDLTLGTFYTLRSRRSARGDVLLLTKYPAFVLIVGAGSPTVMTGLAMILVFFGACAYEMWHDASCPLRTELSVRLTFPPKRFARRRKPDAVHGVRT